MLKAQKKIRSIIKLKSEAYFKKSQLELNKQNDKLPEKFI